MRADGRVPRRGEYTEAARRERLDWLRSRSGAGLAALDRTGLDAAALAGNIENLAGGVEVPVGLAGPLEFRGQHARGSIVAPLATTEGALVASASRGASAITRCGGVTTRQLAQRMIRAPAWEFANVDVAARFGRWIHDQRRRLEDEARLVSRHSRLTEVEPVQIGRVTYVRFVYETEDAAGQNMTTACTWRACQWVNGVLSARPDLEPLQFVIESNMSGDKKAGYLNLVGGRGSRVVAECFLDRATVRDVLKTTPEAMDRGHRVSVAAAQHAGMLGYSINVANMIAALFLATGQDVGCVHECGSGIFSVDPVDDGLHATMLLPNVIVGSVGGGTTLPAQRDCLEAIGCAGDGKAARLAEVICGFALALDLSTGAAVAGGQFAAAHERLGRRRRVDWLRLGDLDAPLVEPMLASSLEDPELRVSAVTHVDGVTADGILTELTAKGERRKLIGLYPLRVTCESPSNGTRALTLMAKVKPLDQEVTLESGKVASMCGGRLAEEYQRWREWTGLKDTHTRELALYRLSTPELAAVRPRLYGAYEDPLREAYVLLMEHLGSDVIKLSSGDRLCGWTRDQAEAALRGIAPVHGAWLGRDRQLLDEGVLGRVAPGAKMVEMRELWGALLDHNAGAHPNLLDPDTVERLEGAVDDLPRWWAELEELPRTLVHNDFNPRNVALRRGDLRLVAYDWELATLHVPQRDLAEFLAFGLPPDADPATVAHLVEIHRDAVQAAAGMPLDRETWRRGYRLALLDFAITRLQLYLVAHTHREYGFLPRVVATVKRLLDIEEVSPTRFGVLAGADA